MTLPSETTIAQNWMTTTFKVSPVIFSLFLDFAGFRFDERWEEFANTYFGNEDVEWDRDDVEWRYKHMSVFLFDKIKSKFSLVLALVYVGFVFAIEFLETGEILLLPIVLGAFLLSLFWWLTVDKWFRVNSQGRDPDRYFNEYYNNGNNDGERIFQPYYKYLPTSLAKNIHPHRVSIFSEIILIVTVVNVDLVPAPLNVNLSMFLVSVVFVSVLSLWL